ncbi:MULTISPECIES: stage II sporulation protein R [Carboxydocella]|uniref:Stage II sporulation protein R n=2 Tax=Carboxydocella TaxID=178898 RepID=A0A1T4RET9_9FIRM|nr:MULTISPECIES: stage II sporulation protein R [Carboxydocella]AVX21718.1 stage II sporulation protein R [Carboxydocella thermautotrophica]AVX32129.1 stage II sporulation protein R [Carboxydocella thermautotrophica]SKA14524.1 stage II sporulation protein R [Carboxydocella sporoproducens DSM 16521]GAW27636.1 stage II sporulation protein R [Carboxydocella sp. ULO1]GAW31831.1 stage II sporulation protein R [Carboxydocella sp. JDF658]
MYSQKTLLWLLLLSFFLIPWIFLFQPDTAATNPVGPPQQLLRLHVIANSDQTADQAVKLKVRDAILAYLTPRLVRATSLEQAQAIVIAAEPEIIRIANQTLAAQQFPYQARVEIGRFPFPSKSYGTFNLPAGRYLALRVLLGQAQGKNWWCVLFPPLCFVDLSHSIAENPSPPPRLRSRILEWWQERQKNHPLARMS